MKIRHALRQIPVIVFAACVVFQAEAVSTAWGAAAKKPSKSDAAADAAQPAGKVDLNTATAEELEGLPGIGAATAKKIIAGRPYKSVKDLAKSGIPQARLDKIAPLVTVTAVEPAQPAAAAKTTKTAKSARTKGAASTATAPTAASEKPAALVDLNTATAEQLEELPGIGPAFAKKIIAARPYKSVQDLEKSGIPAVRLEKALPLVTVAAVEPSVQPAPKAAQVGTKPATSTEKPSAAVVAQTPPQKGMVWVNTDSKVYHKEGSRWYGKTKAGKWMTEEDAIKDGNRAGKDVGQAAKP